MDALEYSCRPEAVGIEWILEVEDGSIRFPTLDTGISDRGAYHRPASAFTGWSWA